MLRKVTSWVFKGTLFLVLILLTFALFEGLSSTVIFGTRLLKTGRESLRYYRAGDEQRHSQYDPMLGWIGMPDRYIPDLYGEGRYLRTDSHGFRSDEEIEPTVPDGRIRAICTGDSFAFGQGVANDRTWCHLLSALEPRLQTVNMGQRGYGVDQAYLWYLRDGLPLDHQVLLFSFIGGDFGRMRNRTHYGYGKPVLRVREGALEVDNTPVPGYKPKTSWRSRLRVAAAQLRSVELARRFLDRSRAGGRVSLTGGTESVAEQLLKELAETCRERNVKLVLIWLPVKREIESQDVAWRAWVDEQATALDLAFIDLSEPMRALPKRQARGFFISDADSDNAEAAGHYNEAGHSWVASELHSRLGEITEMQGLLQPKAESTEVVSVAQ